MIQLIAKVDKIDGTPASYPYLLVTLDEDRLDQVMYRICRAEDHFDEDSDLAEIDYFCPYVEAFRVTSKALQKKLDRLMENGKMAFVYQNLVHIPERSKAKILAPNMTIDPGFAGFRAELKGGEVVVMDPIPGELWESAVDILEHNNEVQSKKTQKEPDHVPKTRSYFS